MALYKSVYYYYYYYKFIIQFAGERIFEIGEHLTKRSIVIMPNSPCTFVLICAKLARQVK